MKIDVGRNGPAAMRCDVYLEGEDDPPFVRIHRGGVVVAEVAVNSVSDAETMAKEVENARRLEAFPVRVHGVLAEMAGDVAGMPGDGTPEQRRQKYADGFVAAIRGDKPAESKSQTWLQGYEAGRMVLREANALSTAYRLARPDRPSK